MAVSGALGLAFERVLILPVYGQHLKQILITMGGLIVAEQRFMRCGGRSCIPLPLPTALRGSFILGDVADREIPPARRAWSASSVFVAHAC